MILSSFHGGQSPNTYTPHQASGTRFVEKCVPVSIEAMADGSRKVTFEHVDSKARCSIKSLF